MIGLNSSIISFHHNPVSSGAADLLWPTDFNYLLRWLLLATFLISLTGIVLVLKKYYFFRIELWPMCPWLYPEGLEKIHKGRQVDPLFRIQTSSPYLFVRLHDCVCATYLSQAVWRCGIMLVGPGMWDEKKLRAPKVVCKIIIYSLVAKNSSLHSAISICTLIVYSILPCCVRTLFDCTYTWTGSSANLATATDTASSATSTRPSLI